MTTLNTTIGTSLAIHTKIAQMQHVNKQTVDCTILNGVIGKATKYEALKRISIHATDRSRRSVLEAQVNVTYRNGVAQIDLTGGDLTPEFMLDGPTGLLLGPVQDLPLCDKWQLLINEYLRIQKQLGYAMRWTVQLSGPHAQDIYKEFGLSDSDIVCAATQRAGDPVQNSHSRDLSIQFLVAPDKYDTTISR